jgi:carbon monoxide dehydrogenase subunit G
MKIENSFAVDAPPDAVFAFLLDAQQVVGCVPGAELVELIDAQTFRGKLKVKVGAVQVAYQGTAHILDIAENDSSATVTVSAEGREIGGQGTVKASITLTVAGTDEGGGSNVSLETDYTVTGRIAQFGRGVIEDISRRLIGQMAEAMRSRLQESHTAEPALDPH